MVLLVSNGTHLVGLWREGQKYYCPMKEPLQEKDSDVILRQTKEWWIVILWENSMKGGGCLSILSNQTERDLEKRIKPKEELLKDINYYLDNTTIPKEFCLKEIARLESDNRFDMEIKVDIMVTSVAFSIRERGQQIIKVWLRDNLKIEYMIIKQIVESYCSSVEVYETDYNKALSMFEKIGEPFKTMYEKKVDIYNIEEYEF